MNGVQTLTPLVVKAIPYNMFCISFGNFFGILQSMLQHCNRLIWLSHGLLIPMVRLNKPDMMPSLPKRYNLVFTNTQIWLIISDHDLTAISGQ